jgi:enamine deaminase RidA (YjgF/YER057c/UK114 family)
MAKIEARVTALGLVLPPAFSNGFSDLTLEPFVPEAGAHARSAVGMAELPFGMPVEIEGEVQISAAPRQPH